MGILADADPAQHWAAILGIVVAVCTLCGFFVATGRWVIHQNKVTIRQEVGPIVEAVVGPIRDAQDALHERLTDHMAAEEAFTATLTQHMDDDRTQFDTLNKRMDADTEAATADRERLMVALRNIQQAQHPPIPDVPPDPTEGRTQW